MLRLPCAPSHNGNAHHPRFAAVRRPLTSALAVLVLGALGSVGVEQSANAATVSCSTPNLISAIATANGTPGGGTLVLATGCVYTLESANNTTEGGTGLPVITGNVAVQGAGATIARSTATGVPAFRIFDVADGGSLTLNALTLSNGLANNGQQGGGAIFNHGTLTVSAGTFTNNSSPAATGTSGGAIDSTGTLSVNTSTFSGNSGQEGGGIMNQSTATVTNSTFAGNNATDFGGGALVNTAGTATVAGDTFVGNTGPGGGALDNDATLNIANSTFTNNTAGTNGGGAVVNFGTTTVNQSTFSGNTSPFGANLYNFTGFTLSMSMDIVAGGLTGTNCGGGAPITDLGYNIDDGTSCGFSALNHSLNNTQPQLDALASNGGSTQTMALPAASPAVDAIPPATPGCPGSTDQRGIARPQGKGCDIGAYELVVTTTSVIIPSNGATVSGTTTLDASASNATSVEFRLFGGIYGYNAPVLCTATPTYYGWLCSWNTTTVPNGSYSLLSEAFGAGGSTFSSAVSITVTNNPPPTTSVIIPSNGATLSGCAATLDASASNATSVEFWLLGGSYGFSGHLVGTATSTSYGWLDSWNTTTVPNGTYALLSEAISSIGSTFSSGVSITVHN
jgi:Bacterial Ig domain